MASFAVLLVMMTGVSGQSSREKWVTAWAASAQGPYPTGNPTAQPDLRFAFPAPASGANDQTLRMVVQPDVWGTKARIRLSNVFGTKPLTMDGVHVGVHMSGATVVAGTNRKVEFAGKESVTVPPGESVWSDAVALPFSGNTDQVSLSGRKLAVSFHVVGESGPMTWHAKALTTSYLSAPGAGSKGAQDDEATFPYSTTSWYFLDAVDMMVPSRTRLVVAFGDSITDGTASTLNGDDRWTNVLARRLHAVHSNRVSVVNAGIGGNQVLGPAEYSSEKPSAGGPSALQRLERDVLSLSGVTTVIWLEGINDLSKNSNAPVEAVIEGYKKGVALMRSKVPGVRVIGGTVISALNATNPAHGSAEEDAKRKQLNEFIRTSDVFDAVVDFDKATIDASTGELRAEFVPDSTSGGKGDKLHPNRAGYVAMGNAVDLNTVFGTGARGNR